jgi:uncharacterized repeat protein (TIGR01451 family)
MVKLPYKTHQTNNCKRTNDVKQALFILLSVLLAALGANTVMAAPTPAGTTINNTAILSYNVSGVPQGPITSNTAQFNVDEIIDVVLTANAPVSVNSPDTNRVLIFTLSNIGNGSESFSLARNNSVAGDSFDPTDGTLGSLFLDSNGNGVFDSGIDTAYSGPILLASGESKTIFVLGNIPPGQATGDTGQVGLTASSTTTGAAGAAPGTNLPGLGDSGVNAIVGNTQAQTTTNGTYIVSGLTISVAKSVVSIADPRGGSNLEPGSIVTYQIVVTATGSGAATNLVVTDPLPSPELTYQSDSITVGGVARTDAADADNASFSGTTVTVDFGAITAPLTLPAIQLKAKLN